MRIKSAFCFALCFFLLKIIIHIIDCLAEHIRQLRKDIKQDAWSGKEISERSQNFNSIQTSRSRSESHLRCGPESETLAPLLYFKRETGRIDSIHPALVINHTAYLFLESTISLMLFSHMNSGKCQKNCEETLSEVVLSLIQHTVGDGSYWLNSNYWKYTRVLSEYNVQEAVKYHFLTMNAMA